MLRAVAMAFAVSMLLTACDVATVEETLADIMGGAPEATAQLDDGSTDDGADAGVFTSPTAADYAAARAAEDTTAAPEVPKASRPPAPRTPDAPTPPPATRDGGAPDRAPTSPEAADGGIETPPSDPDEDAAPSSSVPTDADAAAPADDDDEEPARRPEASTDSSADDAALASVEQQIHDLLTAERQRAGLPPLQRDRELSEDARAWSRRMATEKFFSHDSSGSFAENIAYGYPTAQAVHDGWMASTGHRDNRMNSEHTAYGIGVYKRGDTVYYTERFR